MASHTINSVLRNCANCTILSPQTEIRVVLAHTYGVLPGVRCMVIVWFVWSKHSKRTVQECLADIRSMCTYVSYYIPAAAVILLL